MHSNKDQKRQSKQKTKQHTTDPRAMFTSLCSSHKFWMDRMEFWQVPLATNFKDIYLFQYTTVAYININYRQPSSMTWAFNIGWFVKGRCRTFSHIFTRATPEEQRHMFLETKVLFFPVFPTLEVRVGGWQWIFEIYFLIVITPALWQDGHLY